VYLDMKAPANQVRHKWRDTVLCRDEERPCEHASRVMPGVAAVAAPGAADTCATARRRSTMWPARGRVGLGQGLWIATAKHGKEVEEWQWCGGRGPL